MKDRFSYILPPSPTSTVAVDSYHPTSNWWNGKWAYQDQSYLLHNPALRLSIERSADGSTSRAIKSPIVSPWPLSTPTPATVPEVEPELSEAKAESSSKVGWYVVGGLFLAGAIGYGVHIGMRMKATNKLI